MRFEILSFLKKYVSLYNSREETDVPIEDSYPIEQSSNNESDDTRVLISGNQDLVTTLLDNLIENAKKHGFTPEFLNRLELFVTIREDSYTKKLQITLSNSGQPFPEDFTKAEYIRKGIKGGQSEGSGYGGWLINKIVAKMGGDFEIERIRNEEHLSNGNLVTSIHLIFPIIENNNETD
jgi:type I restriction enzyme M protein